MCLGNHKKLGATREQGWSSKKWGSKADKNRIQESFESLINWVYPEAMKVKGARLITAPFVFEFEKVYD